MAKVRIVCEKCGIEFLHYQYGGRKRFCSKACLYGSGSTARHGESQTRLYGIWCHMKTRCTCKTSRAFSYYGGRGISVCDEWMESYERFRDWAIASGYKDELELDRINTNGNYEPSNCRWATRTQQMRNTRKRKNAKTSKFKGVSKHSQQAGWVTQTHGNGKPKFIGLYKTEIEAALAYDDAAHLAYGEYAMLNFPERKRGALR